MIQGGWGAGKHGSTPWGGGGNEPDSLILESAIALRENVVRLAFNTAPLYTGILDPHDASSRHRYSVVPVTGTVGVDGLLARAVKVTGATVAIVEDTEGKLIDVSLDRGFSPYPAMYRITANNLVSRVGSILDTSNSSMVFYGLQREHIPHTTDRAMETTDIANPQNIAGLDGVMQGNTLVLGAFVIDETHDVALDRGLVSLKKRMLRRCFTKKGAYAHLPNYGIGVAASIKKLNSASNRNKLASETETQMKQEPEILATRVTFIPFGNGGVRMLILGRTVKGAGVRLEQLLNA